jgi:PKD repeat protein
VKNRKVISVLIVAVVLLTLLLVPATPAAADNAVSIDPVSQQQPVGADFTVQVIIDSVTDLDTAQYDITFDPAVIQLTGANVTAGSIGGTTIPVDLIKMMDSTTVRVINNVDGVPPSPGATGSGYLAEVHFHVVGSSGSSSAITLSNGTLGNSSSENITPVTWTGGTVTIAGTLTADFSADKLEVIVGETVTFTDNTTGGSGTYTDYAWDFGDLGTSDVANPTHSYAAAGTYTVELTVTDSLLATDTETKTSYITVYDPLDADFYTDVTEALVGQTITFTDNTSGGKETYTYAWTFGDGGNSDKPSPTHSYTTAGNYTVELTVTDGLTNSDIETRTDYITIYDTLVAAFSASITKALVGETITFNSAATAGGKEPYTYEWDFGDTGTIGLANPTHGYADPGSYTVNLTVTDDLGNTDDFTVIITVFQLGDANEDGDVTILDIIHIEHIIMEDSGYVYTKWADAKQDGVINVLDITATEWIILSP